MFTFLYHFNQTDKQPTEVHPIAKAAKAEPGFNYTRLGKRPSHQPQSSIYNRTEIKK